MNKEFKIREIQLPEFGNVLITTDSLNKLLLTEEGNYISSDAEAIDEKIFYFVEDNEIELGEKELIKVIDSQLK